MTIKIYKYMHMLAIENMLMREQVVIITDLSKGIKFIIIDVINLKKKKLSKIASALIKGNFTILLRPEDFTISSFQGRLIK